MRTDGGPAGSLRRLVGRVDVARSRRLGLLSMASALLAVLAACSGTGSPAPATSAARSDTPAASTGASPAFKPGELTCADAYTEDPLGVESIAFTDAGVGFEALNETGFDPVPVERASLPWEASGGYFSKSPIYLDDDVSWAELMAIEGGDVTFAWVPAGVWTGLARGSAGRTYEAATARFESCEGSYTGFLGGILTPTAHACVTLGIRSNLHPEVESLRVAIGRGACGDPGSSPG